MEITFLGAGHGVPSVDRFCSSALITCGGKRYIVDAGAPVGELLIRQEIPYNEVKGVFITHRHSDHTMGLPHFLALSSWYFKTVEFDVFLPEEEMIAPLKNYLLSAMDVFAEERVRIQAFAAGVIFEDENIKVTAIPTNHMKGAHPSYAFWIEGDGKRVLFTGDLQVIDPVDFPQIAKENSSDAIICEMAHFRAGAVAAHLQLCDTKHVYFNHYNDSWSIPEIRSLQEGENALPVPVTMLRDGDVIRL